MSKTGIVVVALLLSFLFTMAAMKPSTEKPIVYTEDEKAFIKKCAVYKDASDCRWNVMSLRELK